MLFAANLMGLLMYCDRGLFGVSISKQCHPAWLFRSFEVGNMFLPTAEMDLLYPVTVFPN